jgi:hypothetical protein
MSQRVYSVRHFSAGGLTAGAGTVGPVVPAGFVWVVRDIDALEITGSTPAQMEVLNPNFQPFWFIDRNFPQVGANFQWRGRQVFQAGEQIGFKAFSGTWSIMCSGYSLTLP